MIELPKKENNETEIIANTLINNARENYKTNMNRFQSMILKTIFELCDDPNVIKDIDKLIKARIKVDETADRLLKAHIKVNDTAIKNTAI